jgi:hypothetical protein
MSIEASLFKIPRALQEQHVRIHSNSPMTTTWYIDLSADRLHSLYKH